MSLLLANQDKLEDARPTDLKTHCEAICDVCGDYLLSPSWEIVVAWAYGHRGEIGHSLIRLTANHKLVKRI